MSTFANIVVALIAVLHVYILVLEMFLWDKPIGLRAFRQTRADCELVCGRCGRLAAQGKAGGAPCGEPHQRRATPPCAASRPAALVHQFEIRSREAAAASKVLAANQGLYNGFLAAGLFWGLVAGPNAMNVKVFFLACVLIAGLYGAATVGRKILFIQAIPAVFGLALVFLS